MTYNHISDDGLGFFESALRQAIALREKQAKGTEEGSKPQDATDTLVDMLRKVGTDPKYISAGVTEVDVLGQPLEFFIAGYMLTLELLSTLTYELAVNPEIQEKVVAEMREAGGDVGQMPFLSGVILETLRLHLGFSKSERLCDRDWEFEGLRIRKGMQVIFPIYAVHLNPDLHPDPHTFRPERFMGAEKEGRDANSFLPFSVGPRSCMGNRFVIELTKVLTVTFLAKVKFLPRPDTRCEEKAGGEMLITRHPIVLDLTRRE